ncbi:MAG TPA: hypothetical protein VHE57_11215 [Mycobacteriales bacterium]|nr:hypothetical protein [Mycobacteriales bacterium]
MLGGDPKLGLVHGLAGGDAGSKEADSTRGVADGALHAAGKVCGRCGRKFNANEPVRRTGSQGLIHDFC